MAETEKTSLSRSAPEAYPKRTRYRSDSDFVLNKRVPPRPAKRPNEFFITNKSDFKGQLARVFKLLENNEEEEIILRGLGTAVLRTVNLSLQLQEKLGPQYATEVFTYTVHLVDDIEGVPDVNEQTRSNSAIKIRIFNKNVQVQDRSSTGEVKNS
ncbi:processing of precursor 7 [Nesidiocoris tenuis]|uniref:Processing of 7 n=1 Tax=Nesidiocoris tenuis TaxID=355587 RepID=A0ABN7AW03_9HEMI|nr:processing of precursor 7 [Nesidiocoris tenuis]